jgi:UDP-glucose 4-epimerase
MKNKNIFITGGAGFIASALIRNLINDNRITIYDNFTRDTLSNSSFANHPNLKVIKGDVLNYNQLEESMRGADIVVHAAAILGIDNVVRDPVNTMRVNMLGSANCLEAARMNNVKDRYIDFSTSEVFGPMAFRVTEEQQTIAGSAGEGRWTYAVSKMAGEHLAHAYYKQFNLPVVTVRPFNVYGPGQTMEGAMHMFIKKALQNEDITIHGDGAQIRAWCYVDDFVDCLFNCMSNPAAIGQSFNIGNARAVITILGLAQTVCRALNSTSKINHVPPLSADIAIRIPSVDKAEEILGFKAKMDLEDGIKHTAAWMREMISQNSIAL